MEVKLKLPDIPKNISIEMYNYFIQLHQNLKQLEEAINNK